MKLYRLLLKYFVRYFIAFFIILAVCGLLAKVAYESIENYVIEVNQLRLKEGIVDIHRNIAQLSDLSALAQQNEHFKSAAFQKGAFPPEEYLELKYANQQMNTIGLLYPFASYGFTLFRDNDMYLSTSQCAASFDQYYGQFLEVSAPGIYDAQSLKNALFADGGAFLRFLKVDTITFSAQGRDNRIEDAILCILSGSSSAITTNPGYVMVFALSPETLINKLLLPGQAPVKVQITDPSNGAVLVDNDPDWNPDTDELALSYRIPEIGWDVVVSISSETIRDQCRDIRMIILLYACGGLLLALALTLWFSFRQYFRVRKLLFTLPAANRVPPKGQDEYDVLGHVLTGITQNRREYERRLEALTQQNQAILLENLIVSGIRTEEERREIGRCFSQPLEFFCVVLVELPEMELDNRHLAVLCITQFLQEEYPGRFANVHTGNHIEAFLLALAPDEKPDLQPVRKLFEGIIQSLTEDMGITFRVGISAVGADIDNVNTCYNQARQVLQAYGQENQNLIELYHLDINQASESIVDMEFLDKLYNSLLYAQREAVSELLSRLIPVCERRPFQFEIQKNQIFYSIRNVFYCVCLRRSLNPLDLPVYSDSLTVKEMVGCFLKAAEQYCLLVEESRKSHNSGLRDRILQYIKENYASPSLTAATVCREIGISNKYLSQFLKEQTGETFSSYLERIRVEAAIGLLTTTSHSNERIAELSGFAAASTFYRVFHKVTGLSPGAYRNSAPSSPENAPASNQSAGLAAQDEKQDNGF